MTENKYYKCINESGYSFTFGKIYILQNSLENFESFGSFIDDTGDKNGFAGDNHKHFIEVTEEEYNIQENYKLNHNKLINILKFINEKI
jgi:pectate lyase